MNQPAIGRRLRGDGWVAVDLGASATRVAGCGGWYLRERPSPSGAGFLGAPGGEIAEPASPSEVLASMLDGVFRLPWNPLRAVVGIPASAGSAGREAAAATLRAAGVREVATIPRGLAAAIGAGIDVGERYACTVIDIGEVLMECTVIRSGRVLHAADERVGCADLRHAIIRTVALRLGAPVTRVEAERVIRAVDFDAPGGVRAAEDAARAAWAPPLLSEVTTDVLREALEPVVSRMAGIVGEVLRTVPHEAGAEIIENGIRLTGGGALLTGLRHRLERHTGVAFQAPEDPIHAVVRGTLDVLPVAASTGMWSSA